MPRYKDSEREQIREEARRRLVAAAVTEFAEHGYAHANINRISQAAGYAQGTVYNYFRSKRALFEAVLGDIAARHTELILQGAATAAQPAARLERFFAAGFAFAEGFPAEARLVAATLYGPDAEARACGYRAYERLLAYLEDQIVRAGELEGQLRPVDAGLARAAILAVYLGGCSAGEEAARMRQNARAVAGLLLDGLRAPAIDS